MDQLREIMNSNLALTALSALPGGALGSLIKPGGRAINVWGAVSRTMRGMAAANVGIGTAVSVLPALYSWRREVRNFDRDVFTPAMKKASEDCKRKAGL